MASSGVAATLASAASVSPAEAKAREFLALERVAARGNLPLSARFTRVLGASVDDRFRTAEEARRLPPATVMARIAHERETYNKASTPAYVRGVFTRVEELKSRVFANVRRLLDEYTEPADIAADFERVRREVLSIPYEVPTFAVKAFVSEELVAFLQWFERMYTDTVNEVRRARYANRATLARAMPVVPGAPPGPSLQARLNVMRSTRKRRAQRRNRKTRRSQRR